MNRITFDMPLAHLVSRLRRNLQVGRKALESDFCKSGGMALFYPREPWYAENAAEMLRILGETRERLEEGLEIRGPQNFVCLVTAPDWAAEAFGVAGMAFENVILVACRPWCLSEFAGTAAHELAHLLSRSVGTSETPFKSEGFACYAAEVIDADTRPFGLPLHYHLVWMLSVGLRPTLPELWRRRDYTCELYDLGWSFATFVVETYGLERYYWLYRAADQSLDARIRGSLEVSPARLEAEWYAAASASVELDGAEISRMRRYEGVTCSRAAWLGRQ